MTQYANSDTVLTAPGSWTRLQSLIRRLSTEVHTLELGARWVVGADGPRSRVARLARLGVNTRFLVGVEAEFAGVGGVDPERLHCFLDSELAPGYLAWAVPGIHAVQVGLARRRPHPPDLDRCVRQLARVFDFSRAREIGRRGGLIPVGGPVRPVARPGVVLVGDAAGVVSPLTAGGIHTALASGRSTGRRIAEHLLHSGTDPTVPIETPKFHAKLLLRRAIDVRPPNALYNALLSRPIFRALAGLFPPEHGSPPASGNPRSGSNGRRRLARPPGPDARGVGGNVRPVYRTDRGAPGHRGVPRGASQLYGGRRRPTDHDGSGHRRILCEFRRAHRRGPRLSRRGDGPAGGPGGHHQ